MKERTTNKLCVGAESEGDQRHRTMRRTVEKEKERPGWRSWTDDVGTAAARIEKVGEGMLRPYVPIGTKKLGEGGNYRYLEITKIILWNQRNSRQTQVYPRSVVVNFLSSD